MGLTSLPAQLAGILIGGIVLAYWFGYGAARWLLPRELAPYQWLLMPAVGLTLFSLVAPPLALLGVNSATLLWILLPLASVVNASAWWRAPRVRDPIAQREMVAPLIIAGGAFLFAVLPLFAYGYLTVLGYNMDGTVYVAQAEFAKQVGLSSQQLRSIPSPFAVPAAEVIEAGVGVGASLWLSLYSQLWQRDAFYLFAPVLALWHASSFLGVFVLYRRMFRLHFWTAILALAALALNGTRLLIPLDNFAPHTFGLVLLPLEWMATQLYFETRTRRAFLLAASSFGAQVICYPQATPFYLLPFALEIALSLRGANTLRHIESGARVGVLAALLCPVAVWMLYENSVPEVGMVAQAIGGTLQTFLSPAEGLGFNALRVLEHPELVAWDTHVRAVWDVLAWGGVLIASALGGVGLYVSFKTERALLAASGVTLLALTGWMVFAQKYPYGFFKVLATSLFVFVALIAFGAQVWIESWRASARGKRWLVVPTLMIVFLFLLLGVSMFWFQNTFAQRAPVVTRKLIQLSNSQNILAPNASIYLALTRRPNPRLYWAAYFLRAHPLFGDGRVAYSEIHNATKGGIYDYALLTRNENPADNDLPDEPVWEDRWTVLYARR